MSTNPSDELLLLETADGAFIHVPVANVADALVRHIKQVCGAPPPSDLVMMISEVDDTTSAITFVGAPALIAEMVESEVVQDLFVPPPGSVTCGPS